MRLEEVGTLDKHSKTGSGRDEGTLIYLHKMGAPGERAIMGKGREPVAPGPKAFQGHCVLGLALGRWAHGPSSGGQVAAGR